MWAGKSDEVDMTTRTIFDWIVRDTNWVEAQDANVADSSIRRSNPRSVQQVVASCSMCTIYVNSKLAESTKQRLCDFRSVTAGLMNDVVSKRLIY